jgi:hypothetical protein
MGSKAAFWRRHLAAWRASGQSQGAYCRQEDLSLPCFGYWRGKLGTVPSPSTHALLPIVISEVPTSIDHIEVELPNGLQVRLPVGSDATLWAPMIRALMAC